MFSLTFCFSGARRQRQVRQRQAQSHAPVIARTAPLEVVQAAEPASATEATGALAAAAATRLLRKPLHLPRSKILHVWPIPQEVRRLDGPMLRLDDNLRIIFDPASGLGTEAAARLRRAVERHQAMLPAALRRPWHEQDVVDAAAANCSLRAVRVLVQPDGGESRGAADAAAADGRWPRLETSYGYELRISPGGGSAGRCEADASITGRSVYGAMAGLATWAQLPSRGYLNHSVLEIRDWPSHRYRGLMLDSGRRFIPLPAMFAALDGMAAAKLNVLHWHLSDVCRYSVESRRFPELTFNLSGRMRGAYSQRDVAELLEYAADRGIRVIPEVDLPGHSRGLRPLRARGLQLCETDARVPGAIVRDDAGGRSEALLKELLAEVAALFPDAVLHVGMDETAEIAGGCDRANYRGLERKLIAHVAALGKTAMAWDEALLESQAAAQDTIIGSWRSWGNAGAAKVAGLGRHVVETNLDSFYLDLKKPAAKPWRDISLGKEHADRLLGGETAMWTDAYCYEMQCGAWRGPTPVGHAMFGPDQDAAFSRSLAGMVWPRAAVAAGSFWHFTPELRADGGEFRERYDAFARHLIRQGVDACPPGCKCDELSSCGRSYELA